MGCGCKKGSINPLVADEYIKLNPKLMSYLKDFADFDTIENCEVSPSSLTYGVTGIKDGLISWRLITMDAFQGYVNRATELGIPPKDHTVIPSQEDYDGVSYLPAGYEKVMTKLNDDANRKLQSKTGKQITYKEHLISPPKKKLAEPLWLESDLVPAIMANPQYWLNLADNPKRYTESTGAK